MKKMKSIVGLFILGFTCLQGFDLVAAAIENHDEVSIFYKVTTKKGVKGYILGTVALKSTIDFLGSRLADTMNKELVQYTNECKHFFFQRNPKEDDNYLEGSMGIEVLILQLMDLNVKEPLIYGFETSKGLVEIYDEMNKWIVMFNKPLCSIQYDQKNINKIKMENYAKEKVNRVSDFNAIVRLIEKRTQRWFDIFKQNMSYESFFITCEVDFLPGEKGMIALLEKEGFQLEPISLWGEK